VSCDKVRSEKVLNFSGCNALATPMAVAPRLSEASMER
jgi:hypothetical protein